MHDESSKRIMDALRQAWEELGEPVGFDVIKAIASKEIEMQFQDQDRTEMIQGFLRNTVEEEIDRLSRPGVNE